MTRSTLQEYAALIADEFTMTKRHVSAALKLLDEGATIPFIARYRKEATGSMTETQLRDVSDRYEALKEIDRRRVFITDAIFSQGALTPELRAKLEAAADLVTLEDLYTPFKPRRRTRAQAAREAGLEPLANIIQAQNADALLSKAKRFVKPDAGVADPEAALAGALDIIAERVAESPKGRPIVRAKFLRSGKISTAVVKGKEDDPEAATFKNYFDFSEPVRTCNSHRYLAMRRGENLGFLKCDISIDDTEMIERLTRMFVRPDASRECADLVASAVADGYKRLLRPSIENEIAASLKEKSDAQAIALFAENVRQLLLSPPLAKKRVLAIDPGFRTGCKVVCLDQQGNLLADDVIYPTPPTNDIYGATETLCFLVDRYAIDVIAIGNGTAGRETERFVTSIQLPRPVTVVMVSEQGASIYSASDTAIEEFPDKDITVRGAVSIGRRLIDPLAELVKIPPESIGVGQYQHEVNPSALKKALDFTVSQCVNSVGVNLNTASRHLLAYVSGIGPALAENIVKYRAEHGDFTSRAQLKEVARMGEKAFQQCAGFLRIPGAENILDNTGIHPESYPLVEQIAADYNTTVEQLASDKSALNQLNLEPYVTRKVGLPTLTDIILELERPGRDPREPQQEVAFDDHVRSIDDLHIGMELLGKVNNITAFGVFVDLGLKENGLIHISQLSDQFIRSASEVVSIGQPVRVKVIDVDPARGRIALTIKGVSQDF